MKTEAEIERGKARTREMMRDTGITMAKIERIATMDAWRAENRVKKEGPALFTGNKLAYNIDRQGLVTVTVGRERFQEDASEFPSEQMIARVALALMAGMDTEKCLTPSCPNRRNEGGFIDDYCTPCANERLRAQSRKYWP